MPLFRESLRLVVLLSATLTAWSVVAEDEPVEPKADPAPASTERPALPSRSDTMAAGLLRQLPGEEFVSLKAGADEFVALWRPANVGEPNGVIILVHGDGETADWPLGIGPLRRGLPDYGWQTLSLTLPESSILFPRTAASKAPDMPPAEQSEAGEGEPSDNQAPGEAGYLPEETAASPAEPPQEGLETDTSAEPALPKATHAEQISKRIEAAVAYARSKQSAAIVLLGQGTGGYWAARYLQQSAPTDVTGLVVIQPHQPDGQDESLAQLIPTLELSTGDFYYKDGGGSLAAARERLNASRRIEHPAYRQVGLPPQTSGRPIDQDKLLRRVRGWLDKQP